MRRAIRALKVPDGERLDTHSLRRSFVSHGTRAGVPDDVLGRLTGHGHAMIEHYQRETVGDDLRAAQDQVREWRTAQTSSPASSPASPDGEAGKARKSQRTNGRTGIRTQDPILVRSADGPSQWVTPGRVSQRARGAKTSARRRRRPPFSLGGDAELAILARWIDECPPAARRLRDPEVFAQFMAAASAAIPEAAPAKKGKARTS